MKEHYYSNFKGCKREREAKRESEPSTLSDLNGLSLRPYLALLFFSTPFSQLSSYVAHPSVDSLSLSCARAFKNSECIVIQAFCAAAAHLSLLLCPFFPRAQPVMYAREIARLFFHSRALHSRTFHIYTRFGFATYMYIRV